ncbi:2OG-Fe(II) oxygenase [Streptomyces sp. NPDC046197]|uniref:2OG-Fe(II) oxygenase n=1 Tax=Streptomyces sp. NPDC046197 TaxID=3154337 RepID=UPI0033D8520A
MRVSEHLSFGSLTSLIDGELDLIRCRAYCPPETYAVARPRIQAACDLSTYTLTQDLQCVGVSIGEANESAEKAKQYVAEAAATTALIRETLFAGVVSPMDRLLAQLDDVWPRGAGIALSGGEPVLPNVIRRWTAGGQANPHIDQRNSEILGDYVFRRRLGVNVYLEVPPEGGGGDLELWDALVEDELEYRARRRRDYGLNRADLDAPDWVVHPSDGDLFIFDASRVHGVRALSRGRRVTMACFLGVRGTEDPLALFA